MTDVFDRLRAQGHALAVFTGNSTRAAGALLKAAGLDADVLIGGDQVSRPKPAPDGILVAADEIGVDPAGLAYVGDSRLDLRAAAAAGSRSGAASWGHMYDASEPADVVLSHPLQALDLLDSPNEREVGVVAGPFAQELGR
ncbi:HAD family hydrolase [Streptomyces sp. NBC_01431]|uniref:HAD family hydrolase n=1 Tax=Streptomyces sp. NBC_01431 TaxID=2903863 RepID=UPI002E314511|nr:HAD-IA family hydrolase [Streptomyces sp. NBC_01431]